MFRRSSLPLAGFFLAAWLMLTVGRAQAQPVPAQTLTSCSPNTFYVEFGPGSMNVTLSGTHIWPAGWDNNHMIASVKLFFKKRGVVKEVPTTGWNSSEITASVSYADWLDETGTIEIYTTIDGAKSNSVFVAVIAEPRSQPVIDHLSTTDFANDKDPSSFAYLFTIYGRDFGQDAGTSVLINGAKAFVGKWDLMNGQIEVWIPEALRHQQGNYPVQVKTVNGISNAVNISVHGLQVQDQPAARMTASPTLAKKVAPVQKPTLSVRPPMAMVKKDSLVKPKIFTAVQAIH